MTHGTVAGLEAAMRARPSALREEALVVRRDRRAQPAVGSEPGLRLSTLSPAGCLAMQRSTGNAAVGSLLRQPDRGPIGLQRQAVGPKAGLDKPASDFQDLLKGGGPFTVTIYALSDDMIGHAWIRLTRGDGASRTVGFWPFSAFVFAANSLLMSPDAHEAESEHVVFEASTITDTAAATIPSIIQSWVGRPYMLIGQNCTDFAMAVWNASTGRIKSFDTSVAWSPRGLSNSIRFRAWAKQYGIGPLAANDSGDQNQDRTIGDDNDASQTTGQTADASAVATAADSADTSSATSGDQSADEDALAIA